MMERILTLKGYYQAILYSPIFTEITAAQSPDKGARSVILSFAVSTELVRLPVLGLIHVTVSNTIVEQTFDLLIII